jgi:hypothetical protein
LKKNKELREEAVRKVEEDIQKEEELKQKIQKQREENQKAQERMQQDYEKRQREKQQEEGYAVLNGLVNLHERRTNNYINNWGYDEWEKIFRFPNYDYYYFDRLDELYQEELEKELEKEEEFNKLQDELDEYEDYIYNYE